MQTTIHNAQVTDALLAGKIIALGTFIAISATEKEVNDKVKGGTKTMQLLNLTIQIGTQAYNALINLPRDAKAQTVVESKYAGYALGDKIVLHLSKFDSGTYEKKGEIRVDDFFKIAA